MGAQKCMAKARSSCYSEMDHFILALGKLNLHSLSSPSNINSKNTLPKPDKVIKYMLFCFNHGFLLLGSNEKDWGFFLFIF